MYCTKCGAINQDDARFCKDCGQGISPETEGTTATPEIVYAGFWQRFAALFIDGLIMSVAFMLVAFALIGSLAAGGGSMAYILLIYVLAFAMSAAYFILMESGERGATYGKRLLKIRVTDIQGERLTRGRAFGRWLAHALSNFSFYIGYLIQPFTEKKQALHDLASGTIVVSTDGKNKANGLVIGLIIGLVFFIVVIGILAAIAIPAYNDYTNRAKIAQAATVADAATQAVANYYIANGRTPDSLAAAGANLQLPASVSEVNYDANTGGIELVFSDTLSEQLAAKHLSYTPSLLSDGSIQWACNSPDIRPQLLGRQCK